MSRFQNMLDILRPLGLYRLTGGTLVEAELAAYAEGLDYLEERLEALEREAFIETAQQLGIELRESLFMRPKAQRPLKDRREMLLYRGAVSNRDNSRERIEQALIACGIRAAVKENGDGETLYINCYDYLDSFGSQDEIELAASEFLPAHLTAVFDSRSLDWEKIESWNKTFNEMDAAQMTWNEIDAYSP